MSQIERGDQQYQYGEYAESVASYQSALDGNLAVLESKRKIDSQPRLSPTTASTAIEESCSQYCHHQP